MTFHNTQEIMKVKDNMKIKISGTKKPTENRKSWLSENAVNKNRATILMISVIFMFTFIIFCV